MFHHRPIKNQAAKYFLRHWPYYDKNFEYLTETERINMKILYTALKQISKEEREFLADKYRIFNGLPTKDAVMAEKHQMSIQEYKEIRIKYETKLYRFIEKAKKKYKEQINIPETIGSTTLFKNKLSINEINTVIDETVALLQASDSCQKNSKLDVDKVVTVTLKHLFKMLNITIY